MQMQEMPLSMQLLVTVINVVIGYSIGSDARKHGRDLRECWLWGLGAFLILILVLPLYLYMRYKVWPREAGSTPGLSRATGTCKYCGVLTEDNPIYCPSCSKQLRGAESVHGKK